MAKNRAVEIDPWNVVTDAGKEGGEDCPYLHAPVPQLLLPTLLPSPQVENA